MNHYKILLNFGSTKPVISKEPYFCILSSGLAIELQCIPHIVEELIVKQVGTDHHSRSTLWVIYAVH